MIAALIERAHLPLAMLVLAAGIGLAAGARDFMKRLLGACAAMLAGVAHLATLAPQASGGGALAGAVLLLGAGALGAALAVRLREGFGGLDAGEIRHGLEEDEAAIEREAS